MIPEAPHASELCAWFERLGRAVVLVSGGVDSAVLAAAAVRAIGGRALAATGVSHSLATADRAAAEALCAQLGIAQIQFATDEMADPRYTANPVDRCYHCKRELFSAARVALPTPFADTDLVEGTHADDLLGHRPGARAATEAGVRSPYLELGWTKGQVRSAARELALPAAIADRPASPCLASRVPFGTAVTMDRLHAVEAAEAELHRRGYRQCRVRHHGTIARIELPLNELAQFVAQDGPQVAAALRALGFVYTTVDVLGLRSGSMLLAVQPQPAGLQ